MATKNTQAWQRLVALLQNAKLTNIYYWGDWRLEFERGDEKIVAGFFMPWLIMDGANPIIGKHDLPNGQSDPIMDALTNGELSDIDAESRETVLQLGTVTGGEWESDTTFGIQFDTGLRLVLFRSRIGRSFLVYLDICDSRSFVIDSHFDAVDEGPKIERRPHKEKERPRES